MVVIDTDVLLLAFAFQRDPRRESNDTFLQQVQDKRPATTVYNPPDTYLAQDAD